MSPVYATSKSRLKAVALVILLLISLAVVGAGLWLWTPDKTRAELEAKYLTAPTDLIEVAGVRLHVRDTGPRDARALILLHGFGSSLHTWEAWATVLSADDRVVRFDMPGAGLSDPEPTGDYTDRRSLQVLSGLMDRLGIATATLIGHSMGGKVAWNFAGAFPDRVDKLVLISPAGFASPGKEYGTRQRVSPTVALMRYALPKPLLRTSLAAAYGDPSGLTDDVVSRYHDLILAPGVRDAMIARMEQGESVDPVPLLRRVKAPTLLLWGDKDRMIPLTNADDYLKVLPAATLAVMPGLGHVPHEEAPGASLPPVAVFLAQ